MAVILLYATSPATPARAAEAPAVSTPTVAVAGVKADDIVFPPPPDLPKIKFIRSLGRESDLNGKGSGFWSRLVRFLTGKGDSGVALTKPNGVAVRGRSIFVADSESASVVVFDQEARKARRIGGGSAERLLVPIGVAVDDSSGAYVTDSVMNAVKAYDKDGKLRWQAGGLGQTSVSFNRPTGIAWSPWGEIFVADTGHARIVVLSSQGAVVRTFGKNGGADGEFGAPTNLWVEKDGTILVSDSILCRVQAFNADGKFLFRFGQQGDMAGYFSRPKGIASDSDGNIYVVDQLFNAVQVFDRKGNLLLFFGSGGNGPASMELPAGLYIDSQDRIYVADSWNRRIEIFQYLKPPAPSASPASASPTPQ